LNANEEFKQAGPPLDVRERILTTYAKEGFDSIEKNDLRGRMRWWGLYTQRERADGGSRTGEVDMDTLETMYLRWGVPCEGGAQRSAAPGPLGQISIVFA